MEDQKIKNNIISSWKTTLIGFLIIIASVASVFYVDAVTWWFDGLSGVLLGCVLVLAPDNLLHIIQGLFNRK